MCIATRNILTPQKQAWGESTTLVLSYAVSHQRGGSTHWSMGSQNPKVVKFGNFCDVDICSAYLFSGHVQYWNAASITTDLGKCGQQCIVWHSLYPGIILRESWRDNSEVKCADCSSKCSEFSSPQPHGSLQSSIMGSDVLFCHVGMHVDNTVYIFKK